MRFLVLTAASIKISDFWERTLCSLDEIDYASGVRTASIITAIIALMRVYVNETTRRCIPQMFTVRIEGNS
jgi:hypothetical protein